MSEQDQTAPKTVVGEDGIERHLVGDVTPLPTRPTRAALVSVPDVGHGHTETPTPTTEDTPAPAQATPTVAPGPGLPVRPRGPRPAWYTPDGHTPTGDVSPSPVEAPSLPARVTTREQVEALTTPVTGTPAAEDTRYEGTPIEHASPVVAEPMVQHPPAAHPVSPAHPVAPATPVVEEVPDWAAIRPPAESTDEEDVTLDWENTPTPAVDTPALPTSPLPLLPSTPAVEAPAPVVAEPALLPDVVGDDWGDLSDGDDEDEFDEPEESTDTAAAAVDKKAARPVGVKMTDRDVALLQFLTRYKYATYPQIADHLDTSVNALRQRFPRLKKAGLITSDNGGPNAFLVWRPTDTGVKLSGYDMRTPTLSWGAVNHTLGLVDLGIRFEKAGEVVVTEREIRAADNRDRPSDRMATALAHHDTVEDEPAPLFVVTLGAGQGQYSHIPDMVLVRAPQPDGAPMSVAIELELQRKPPTQWRKVLHAYRRSPNIGGVMYFTHRRDIARSIQKVAAELNMTDMVQVRSFTPSAGSKMPTPGVPA